MSIKVMSEVWKDAPVAGTELLMLLALADNANDDYECYPSIGHLAHKTRLSERQVTRLLKSLERQQCISIKTQGAKGRGKVRPGKVPNLYEITPETWVTQVTPEAGTGDAHDIPTGDAHDIPTGDAHVTQNHHMEPSTEPSEIQLAPDGAAVDASPFVRTIQPDAPIFNKDRVFDVLAFVCWGIRDMRDLKKPVLVKGKEKDNPAGAMIGKIKNWLMQLYPEKDEAFVAERVRTFYYDTPEAKRQYIPKDLAKFITAWLKWYQKDLPAPKLKEAAAGYTDELLPGAELE